MEDKMSKEDYNNEPVYYCKRCHSLNISVLGDDLDCCDDCGSTDIDSCHIEEWIKKYKQ